MDFKALGFCEEIRVMLEAKFKNAFVRNVTPVELKNKKGQGKKRIHTRVRTSDKDKFLFYFIGYSIADTKIGFIMRLVRTNDKDKKFLLFYWLQ